MDTVANGLAFRGGQRPVDPLGPTRWTSPARKAFRSTYLQTNKKRNPPQEVAHASIFRGLQHKMPVVGHSLLELTP
jgi:hypothetical protein